MQSLQIFLFGAWYANNAASLTFTTAPSHEHPREAFGVGTIRLDLFGILLLERTGHNPHGPVVAHEAVAQERLPGRTVECVRRRVEGKIGAREIALRLMFSVNDRNMRFDPAPHQPSIEGLDGNRNFSRTAGIVA